MRIPLAALFLIPLTAATFAEDIDFIVVDEPGNQGIDIYDGHSTVTIGGVDHVFRIGKYELTNGQFLEFINHIDPDGVGVDARVRFMFTVSNPSMIQLTSADPKRARGDRYVLLPGTDRLPVALSWFTAVRFCNWLHNGKGGAASMEGTDVSGAYDTRFIDDGIWSNDPAGHNPGARFWIPSESEWVKAGYYRRGGLAAGYWNWPTRSDSEPKGEFPPGGANSYNGDSWIGTGPQYTTVVGSYASAFSPYGCFDMAGNVQEWTESWKEETPSRGVSANTFRVIKGGDCWWWNDHPRLNYRNDFFTANALTFNFGVRIAAAMANQAPVIATAATAVPSAALAGQAVTVSVSATDSEGDALSYAWSFGDGSNGIGNTVAHAFGTAGTYQAVVTVSDGHGGSASSSVTVTVTAPPAEPSFDGGFETPNLGPGGYQYGVAGSGWTFAGAAGITGNGSGFTASNPNAPQGIQAAFLQGTGSCACNLSLAAGAHRVTFKAAQRGNWQSSWQAVAVYIDERIVGVFQPMGTTYENFSTLPFAVGSGEHRITLVGLNLMGGDNTAFIDAVAVASLAPIGVN